MTAQEAYRKFTEEHDDLVVMSCHEYSDRFVFHAVPPEYATPLKAAKIFDSLYSVDKKNGSIASFRPTDVSTEDYRKAKRITIYDR